MAQEQKHPAKNGEDEAAAVEAKTDEDKKAALDADVDDILDEIDDVLETNAEDFVRAFIQKGGQ